MNCTEKMCADKVVRPDEALDDMTCHPIGKWGRMHRDYLKSVHPDLYRQLLQNGTLSKEMADVNERVYNLLDQLIRQMASREHITEQLKASDQMEWVRGMNSIHNRAEEIVKAEVIHTL